MLYLNAILNLFGILDLIYTVREKLNYVHTSYTIRKWTFVAAYYASRELGIKDFKVRFKKSSGRDIAAWTDPDNETIRVTFYIQDIIDTWNLIPEPVCTFEDFVLRLARHEFRHVWQMQRCFAACLRDGQVRYELQVREADANSYALGCGYAQTPEEFERLVDDNLRVWSLM